MDDQNPQPTAPATDVPVAPVGEPVVPGGDVPVVPPAPAGDQGWTPPAPGGDVPVVQPDPNAPAAPTTDEPTVAQG